MDCLTPYQAHVPAGDDHQNEKVIVPVRQIFQQIQENVNRLEFPTLLDNLNLLCKDRKCLEIVKDKESENLTLYFFLIQKI